MPVKERIEICVPGAKEKFALWITTRGGIQIWNDQSLSRLGPQQFTPVFDENGQPNKNPPRWGYALAETVTDFGRFRFISEMREVKRIRIATRMGSQGTMLKLTDHSSAKLRRVCQQMQEKHGVAPCYVFDGNEAIIQIPVFEADDEKTV